MRLLDGVWGRVRGGRKFPISERFDVGRCRVVRAALLQPGSSDSKIAVSRLKVVMIEPVAGGSVGWLAAAKAGQGGHGVLIASDDSMVRSRH